MSTETTIMEICPVCKKPTARQYMWYSNEEKGMCLLCHHKEEGSDKKKSKDEAGVKAKLHSSSATRGLGFKIFGTVFAVFALIVGIVYAFYRPQAERAIRKITGQPEKVEAAKGGGAADKKKEQAAAIAQAEAKKAEDAKKAGLTVATKTGNGGKQERMAPTAAALISALPQNKIKQDAPTAAPAAPGVVGKVAAVAGKIGGDSKDAPALNPNEKTKTKAEKNKAAALNFAAAVIDKRDADGTKTAAALAKLGAVSTTFADVATKLAGPSKSSQPSSGTTGTGAGSKSTKLEGDVLAAQGDVGYDVYEAMLREEKILAAGGKVPTTVRVGVNGNPPSGQPGSAGGVAAPALVQRNTALAVASLPKEFANAARSQTKAAGGIDPANPNAPEAANMDVIVLSMRGDLIFDFNSSGLRPQAEEILGGIASVLKDHPELPVLVRGYTDGKGSDEANLALSLKRATSVREWFAKKAGLDVKHMVVQGLGASDPVALNQNEDGSDNPAGREKNRRVTLTIPQNSEAESDEEEK